VLINAKVEIILLFQRMNTKNYHKTNYKYFIQAFVKYIISHCNLKVWSVNHLLCLKYDSPIHASERLCLSAFPAARLTTCYLSGRDLLHKELFNVLNKNCWRRDFQ